jgi:hypothetical protein
LLDYKGGDGIEGEGFAEFDEGCYIKGWISYSKELRSFDIIL